MEDPETQPPSPKRLRLEERGAVPEGAWRLPLVPRLSEVEKVWESSPRRPLKELLLSANVLFGSGTEFSQGVSVSGAPWCDVGRRQESRDLKRRRSWRSLPSQSFQPPPKASRRFSEAEFSDSEVLGVHSTDRIEAEAGQLQPNAPMCKMQEAQDAKQCAPQDGDSSHKVTRSLKRTLSPLFDITFYKKTKPGPRDIKNRTLAHTTRVMTCKKEKNIPVLTPQISKSQNLLSARSDEPSCLRDGTPQRSPNFPADFNSKMSSVYLKEIAKKNDTKEAYVRDVPNVYWPQNRPDVKQKLQDAYKRVAIENTFPEYYESNPSSLSNQNTYVRKNELISVNYYNSSRLKPDIRYSGKKVTVIVENADWEDLTMGLLRYLSTFSLEKSHTLETRNYNSRYILTKPRENRILDNYGTKCQTMRKTEENVGLLQLLEVDSLGKGEYYSVKSMNTYGKQSKSLMIGMQCSQKALINYFWLNDKEENDSMLQLRYDAIQKGFHLSSIFESFITEIFCFYESISETQNNDILTWYENLTRKKHVGGQNLVMRNMNINRKHNILGIYLQTSFSEPLKIILKANIDSLLNKTDSSTITESNYKLRQAYIFKWIVHLKYPKNVMENQTVYLGRILMFSKLLEDTLKPMLEKMLFKSKNVFEESKGKSIYSSSMTMATTHFPIFESYERIPLSMNFDDVRGMFWTKEIAYSNKSCPEQLILVKNRSHIIRNTVESCVILDPQLIQSNHRCINEYFDEINTYNLDLDIKRKQKSNKLSNFTFKCTPDDILDIRQLVIPKNQDIKCRKHSNQAPIAQTLHLGNLRCENEGKEYDLTSKKEEKGTTASGLVLQNSKIGKEEKNYFFSMNDMFSVQPVLLMTEKVPERETNRYIVQSDVTDDNGFKSIFQDKKLANLKYFYSKKDCTESENDQLDFSIANKECFQDLTAKCLSTEALTTVKDFEMKSKFDLVLEELRVFHEISKGNEILSTAETKNDQENFFRKDNVEEVKMKTEKDLKMNTVNKICVSSLHCDNIVAASLNKRHQSLFKWKKIPKNDEQQVPKACFNPRTSEEELFYSTEEDGANHSAKRPALFANRLNEEKFHNSLKGDGANHSAKRPALFASELNEETFHDSLKGDGANHSAKRPALFASELNEETFHDSLKGGINFSNGISRVLPLKTCSRPIRIGLSRNAKLKQLHPYLK
ncbi:RAD51-associated protein 2 [Suncus etruscus]|uniref:RAD51-associated protein 2 n=1 Tax=Suncus etruscus TaxID=109475 RepID=UPI00211006C8|nr:RAD51-associated protein 2 [Suncus etruscus]